MPRPSVSTIATVGQVVATALTTRRSGDRAFLLATNTELDRWKQTPQVRLSWLARFTLTLEPTLQAMPASFTATVTSAAGATSEFSKPVSLSE